jgi:hypothetical protein
MGLRPTNEDQSPRVRVAQTPGLGLRFVLHEPRTGKRGPRYPLSNDFRVNEGTQLPEWVTSR